MYYVQQQVCVTKTTHRNEDGVFLQCHNVRDMKLHAFKPVNYCGTSSKGKLCEGNKTCLLDQRSLLCN